MSRSSFPNRFRVAGEKSAWHPGADAAKARADGRRKQPAPPLMARLLASYTDLAKKGEAGDRANGPDFVTEKGGSL